MNREDLLLAVRKHIQNRIATLVAEVNELQRSNADNGKSTAGDKHDTERAMVHIELENLSERLLGERRNINALTQIENQGKNQYVIGLGSIVQTNTGLFLLGIPCGKVSAGNASINGISMQSPLASELAGKALGDQVMLRENVFSVIAVL